MGTMRAIGQHRMNPVHRVLACSCLAIIAVEILDSRAAAREPNLSSSLVAGGFTHPVFVTHAPNDYSRLFVVEQPGRISIVNLVDNTVLPGPFLDVSSLVNASGLEYGLLMLAF